ncbi:rod shape-determining protein MreC [Janibacter anophelis]|uniref:rod shape-determining protein MreC n=1 Tax=Janibacter anophelis TaxID=319054 RepID=UPI00082EBD27|nr:rod shape-determining protein MreC [Janibacter anophelis]
MRRRVLPALLVLTVLVLLADLAGAPLGPVRGVGDAVLGPVVRLVAPGGDTTDLLKEDNLALAEEVRRLRDREQTGEQIDDLDTGDLPTVTGRVVALDRAGASGPERVTLDIGRRDGVRTDSAVIAPEGLVGRVVSVSEWSSDVSVIGSPGAGVGVRSGPKGVIGTLSGSDPTTSHAADELVITQLTRDRVTKGDTVTTLGSPGSRPYPPGISVGKVTRVERAPGRLTDTAIVRPAVDLATVDVVAVVTGPGRTAKRAS